MLPIQGKRSATADVRRRRSYEKLPVQRKRILVIFLIA